eukprot:COSAG06_NODE_235_length_19514_cov_33.329333_4_plen_719_part_00
MPTLIEEEKIDELLAYGSEFWTLAEDGKGPANDGADCMRALERMLRLVAEDRREKKAVQTDAVHALIKKTATIDGAIQSFVIKYGDRRRLLRCAQHILHGSSISTTGAMQTVLISAVLALVIFTGFGHFVVDPGWLSETIMCDQASELKNTDAPISWKLMERANVTDRWSCGLACRAEGRKNPITGSEHTLFRYSAQCKCAPTNAELDKLFKSYPQCFDDVVLDTNQLNSSWAESATKGSVMDEDYSGDPRVSQLLHAKLVILRYWDVQLCRYVLQVSVPASFVVICLGRIFAGLPPLKTVRSMWLPWFMTAVLLSAPVVLMYLPSLIAAESTAGIRNISLSGAHLYLAVLLMVPLIMLCFAMWYLCYYCRRENRDFPISRYHCIWGFFFMVHLVVGIKITLWTEMTVYGDENWDLRQLWSGTDELEGAETSVWETLYEDNNSLWATCFKTGTILLLGTMSSTAATMCTKADCLAIETHEQMKQIAADAERRRELEADKTCLDKLKTACLGDQFDKSKLIREKEATTSNKWTSGNPAPHVELTVVPSVSDHYSHPDKMTHEDLHSFETSIELLLNIKLAMTGKKKIDASIDAYFPGNGRIVVHVWFSPPEYLQEVLAMPDKTAYVLDALLLPLDPPQVAALAATAKQGELQGWAASFIVPDSPAEEESPPPAKEDLPAPSLLVRNLVKEKNLPNARWADELDFCTYFPNQLNQTKQFF